MSTPEQIIKENKAEMIQKFTEFIEKQSFYITGFIVELYGSGGRIEDPFKYSRDIDEKEEILIGKVDNIIKMTNDVRELSNTVKKRKIYDLPSSQKELPKVFDGWIFVETKLTLKCDYCKGEITQKFVQYNNGLSIIKMCQKCERGFIRKREEPPIPM